MQLYSIAKYENITDRIKRLANNANANTNSGSSNQKNEIKTIPIQGINRYDKESKDSFNYSRLQDRRQRYQQSINQTSQNTTAKYALHHSNQIFSKRENPTKSRWITEKSQIYDRNIDYTTNFQESIEETQQKKKLNECSESQSPKTLTKAKSDGSLKIQEILQSYNNYKSNKQQFLSTLNKTTSNKLEDNKLSNKFDNIKSQQKNPRSLVKNKIFEQIDNIWNQGYKEKEQPCFQRSNNKQSYYKNCIENKQFQEHVSFNEVNLENRSKSFEKQRIFLKGTQKVEKSDKLVINTLLSPRGIRVPGKICKNNDKTFCGIQKYI